MRVRIAFVMLTLLAVACDAPADLGSTDEPPWGLDAVAIPDTTAEVQAVFAALPADFGGLPRMDNPSRFEGGLEVEYGPVGGVQPVIRATPIDGVAAAMGSEITPIEWIDTMTGDLGDLEESSLDPDADLAWFIASTEADDETAYLAVWCVPDGSWYFDVVGASEEDRRLLVAAFVTAVSDG